MPRRFTCTDKWEDVWFSELDLDMKAAWIYILDKCDNAGIWKRNFKNLCFHCSSTKSAEEITDVFKSRIIEINNGKWFIPKFLKFQYPSGLNSNKPAIISVRNKLKEENLLLIIKELFNNDYLMIEQSLGNDSLMIEQSLKTKTIQRLDKDNTNSNSKTEKEYSPMTDEIKLSELLLNLISKRNPNFKKPNIQKWAKHINLMMRIDNQNASDIKKVIEWCQADSFWQNNILSTEKLRKQYDQLYLKMNGDSNGQTTRGKSAFIGKAEAPADKYAGIGEEFTFS